MTVRLPRSPLFPYTTLFRSQDANGPGEPVGAAVAGRGPVRPLGIRRAPESATPTGVGQPGTPRRPTVQDRPVAGAAAAGTASSGVGAPTDRSSAASTYAATPALRDTAGARISGPG